MNTFMQKNKLIQATQSLAKHLSGGIALALALTAPVLAQSDSIDKERTATQIEAMEHSVLSQLSPDAKVLGKYRVANIHHTVGKKYSQFLCKTHTNLDGEKQAPDSSCADSFWVVQSKENLAILRVGSVEANHLQVGIIDGRQCNQLASYDEVQKKGLFQSLICRARKVPQTLEKDKTIYLTHLSNNPTGQALFRSYTNLLQFMTPVGVASTYEIKIPNASVEGSRGLSGPKQIKVSEFTKGSVLLISSELQIKDYYLEKSE